MALSEESLPFRSPLNTRRFCSAIERQLAGRDGKCSRSSALLPRKAQRQEVYYLWGGHADDPEDAHILEAAIAAQASRLVTFNTGDFIEASQLDIEARTPGEFLRAIE